MQRKTKRLKQSYKVLASFTPEEGKTLESLAERAKLPVATYIRALAKEKIELAESTKPA